MTRKVPAHRFDLLKQTAGLTLIEIMVVLIILTIVMTFLGSKIFGAGDKAKQRITNLTIKGVKSHIEQFQLQYNSLPSGLDDLIRCTDKTGEGCIAIANEDELNDAWGNRLIYEAGGNGRTYRIKSLGADGKDGGDGVDYDLFEDGP